jgi:hypothetical protein
VFERKIIRRIYGSIRIEGNWRIRTNKETDDLIEHGVIESFVKSLRIRWLGHFERMNNNNA